MPGAALGTADTAVSETDKAPRPYAVHESSVFGGRSEKEYVCKAPRMALLVARAPRPLLRGEEPGPPTQHTEPPTVDSCTHPHNQVSTLNN